jgi:DNA repair exonuclease SbcCD ATPase subunit
MVKIISINNTKTIKRIYHISDIHIRLDSHRHDEYREVFERLYEEIKKDINLNESVIIITGDILHSKTNLKPECIEMVKDLFYNLSLLTDVIAILGNHDCNMNNEESMDSLHPIIRTRFEKKNMIKLLTDNRIYQFGNLLLGVTNLYANKVTRCLVKSNSKFSKHIKIGLYHGFVAGAYTELGHSIKKEKGIFDIKDFDDYDYVLLGDVHKFQYLDEKKRSAYASSLIQQNYSESLENHGMIKWDLEKGTNEFIKIKNDYGFVTLKISNSIDGIKDLDKIVMPKYARIRMLYSRDIDSLKVIEYEKQLKSKYNVIEFIPNREIDDDNISINLKLNNKNDSVDIQSNENVIDIIMNYVEKNCPQYMENKEKIKKTLDEILKTIEYSYNNTAKNISLKKLIFNNTFSYGEKNEIDFSKLNKIVGLVAPNHHGKSCLINTLLHGIFGYFPYGVSNEVLNVNEKEYSIITKLNVNTTEYMIYRHGETGVKKKNISETLQLNENNNVATQISKTETESYITEKICEEDDLIKMNFVLQGDEEFIHMNDSKRKDLLYKYFNLDIFKKITEAVSENFNSAKHYASQYNSIVKKHDKDEYMEKINVYTMRLKELEDEKNTNLKEKEMISLNILKITDELNEGNNIINSDELRDLINSAEDKIKEIDENLDNKNNTLEILLKAIRIRETKIKNRNTQLEEYEDIHNEKKEFENDKIKKIKANQSLIEELLEEKEPCKEEYNIDEINEILNKNKEDLTRYTLLLNKSSKLIKEIDNEFIDKNKDIPMELEQLIKENENIKKEMIKLNEQKKNTLNNYDKIKNHKFNKDCEACMSNPLTNQKILLKEQLTEIDEKIEKNNSDVLKYEKKIKSLNKTAEKYNELYEQYKINLKHNELIDTYNNKIKILNDEIEYNSNKLKRANNYDKIKKRNHEIDIQIKKLRELIKNIEESEYEKYNEYINLCDEKKTIEEELNIKKNKLDNLKKTIDELTQEKDEYKIKIKSHESDIIKLKEYDDKKKKIKEYQNKIKKIDEVLLEIKKDESNLNDKIIGIKVEIERINDAEMKRNEYLEKKDIYGDLVEILGKNGFSNTLFKDEILPKLEHKINTILECISDFTIEIEYDKGAIKIYKNVFNKRINLAMMSGYEKFITNVSFRLALCDLNNSIKTDFFIIDEGFSYCDADNLEKLKSLFEYLREKFKWSLVVSHLDEIKENFDTSIHIDIVSGKSYIKI